MRRLTRFVPLALVPLLGVATSGDQPVEGTDDPASQPVAAAAAAAIPAVDLAPEDVRQPPIRINEWTVPWDDTRPRDPYVGPEGRVWFVGQRGDYIAYLEPASGQFERYELDEGTGPHNLIVADDGYVWYAGNRARHIGRLDPATGDIEKIMTPDIRDPHTLVFDSNGDIWFTAQGANVVGKLTVATREVEYVEVPTDGARPYGIVVDSNDRPWIAMVGTYKLATVDPQTMELREIDLPRTDANPRRIGVDSQDRLWYVDYSQGYLGLYDPAADAFEEWRAPSASEARPYGMAMDDRGRPWFVETGPQPNRFIGFDPSSEEFFSVTDVESGGGTIRHMYFHPPTGVVWFGADTNTIGRAHVGEAAVS